MNIELRRRMKRKKPDFIRQDAHKKSRLGVKWRKPKGIQSKMRLRKKGKRRSPEPGFGSPKDVFGLSKDGLEIAYVTTLKDLSRIKGKQAAVISSTVGKKKRIEIVKKALEMKIKILNFDTDKFLARVEEEAKKKAEKKKEKKVKEVKPKKKPKLEEAVEEEELKEKKEMDKVLIKKE